MRSLTIQEWLDFDARFPAPTFFARPAWALALADVTPSLTPFPAVVSAADGQYVVASVRSSSRAGFSHVTAFPLGGYTCVLDERGRCADALAASRVYAQLGASADYATIVPWPLADAVALARAQRSDHETAVIDCRNGFDAAVSNVRGVTRRMAGQAQRRGVTCAASQGTPADIDDYYAILTEAAAGWGLSAPPYSKAFITALFARGGKDVELWFAQIDGERIAGGIVFFGSAELFFWSAAMRRSHSQFRPSNALNFALIQAACDRGMEWYNLGASVGLAGVERFKTDLGARGVTYSAYTFKRPHFMLYERLRSRFRAGKEAS